MGNIVLLWDDTLREEYQTIVVCFLPFSTGDFTNIVMLPVVFKPLGQTFGLLQTKQNPDLSLFYFSVVLNHKQYMRQFKVTIQSQ